ncbi:hypothetical protein A6C57_00125 [Fibrella sp. ES10-3-2-2]|nr:hypothetical protein A6C57_00125 [Fibrella sp. ES10-3-2-2]
MKLHPTRQADDDHLFDNGYNPYRSFWLAFVPNWVDRVLLWTLLGAVGAGIAYRVFWNYV